jgi:hypothetical protein
MIQALTSWAGSLATLSVAGWAQWGVAGRGQGAAGHDQDAAGQAW